MSNPNPSNNKKKGFMRRIIGGSPSTNLSSQSSTADPSSDNVQPSRGPSGLKKLFKGKKSQDDRGTEGSKNVFATPSQRSSLNLPVQTEIDDQAADYISQGTTRIDTSASPALAIPAVAQDLPDRAVQPSSPPLINISATQSSLDQAIVSTHIQTTALPVSMLDTSAPAAQTISEDLPGASVQSAIQAGDTVVLTQIDPATALAGDESGSQAAPPKKASGKENLKVAGRFLQTLITRIPEVIDSNPVKMAFSIAKVVIDVKNTVTGNMDTVERKIVSVAEQLAIMESALGHWEPKVQEEKLCLERLNTVFKNEMENLTQLQAESIVKKIADYEDQKSRIADIFERVNEARIQFGLATDLRIFKAIHAIEEIHKRTLLKNLEPSKLADHKYHLEGEKEVLRREVCTPDTREQLLKSIVTWATGTSSATIFWLFGRAGTGKTTIAFTIARRFELATSEDVICLGGNFFASRQFEETRLASHIVRTIVYHLALRCKPFADALTEFGDFDTINQNVRTQLDSLLVGPWQKSEAARVADSSPQYLIIIDALDEIAGKGGSAFLRDLLDTINTNHLHGLKFFVTSRPDPKLEVHVATFTDRQQYHLEEVPFDEVEADIRMYLSTNLPHADLKYLNIVVTSAAGLFIYASTIVKYIGRHTPREQNRLLKKLFSASVAPEISRNATALLDELYRQILNEAFGEFDGDVLLHRLQILFTLVCTSDRISTATATKLVNTQSTALDSDSASELNFDGDTSIADNILECLHAVLYVENNKVLWHHKSFPDFLFDQERSSDKYWCDQSKHHYLLLNACFNIMQQDLQFNIAGIESSFVFDKDNTILPGNIIKTISPTLSYACQKWNTHLPFILPSEIGLFCQTVSEFLQLPALFWIEAMNLLKVSGNCSLMLRKLCQLVKKNDPNLTQQLVETANFATYFSGSPSTLCTPHLYLSSLSTWPRNLEPCGKWKNLFPGIPAFKSKSYSGVSLLTIRAQSKLYCVAFSPDSTQIVSGFFDYSIRVWDASTGHQINVFKGHRGYVSSIEYFSDGVHIVSGSYDYSVRVWNTSTGQQIKVLKGHTNFVLSVAISPDNTHIVSGCFDGSALVWDTSTGHQINVYQGHKYSVNSVAFSPDSRKVVSGSEDRSVQVWDSFTCNQINVFQGHTDYVNSVAFSSDGIHIVSGSHDKSVRMWDTSTGHQMKVFQGHTDHVNSVAFSPDGKHIVSGSSDNLLWLWDASTGHQINVLQGHTDDVKSVAFSPDGTHIVSGADDQSVRVWDASTGHKINVHTQFASPVAHSSDGGQMVSQSDDKSVQVWNVSTGDKINVLEHKSDIYSTNSVSVAFSPDGKYIVSGSVDNLVKLWDVSTGHQINVLQGHTNNVNSVAFSPNGRHIVSGSNDQLVRTWDASTGHQINIFKGHTERVNSVAFSPNNMQIVSGSNDESVRIWDLSTCNQINVFQGHTNCVTSVAFSPNSTFIVSGSKDKSVRVWDISNDQQIHIFCGHTSWVSSVAFCPSGKNIISGSNDGSICLWDVSTGTQINVLQGHTDHVNSVAFSPDGTHIVSGSSDQSVRVWDISTGHQINILQAHTGYVNSVAFSSDGRHTASGTSDKLIQVWDISTHYQINVFQGHTHQITSVAFSSDSTHLVSGSYDNVVRLWDASTGHLINVLQGHTYWVSCVAFSPDGTNIISGSHDKSIKVWDISTGHQIKTLKGHTHTVQSVAFSPDGRYIVSGSIDYSVRIWDASTYSQINVLQGHTDCVISVAFSSDGRYIVSGSDDKSVQVWDAFTGQHINTLQGHTDRVYSVAFSPDGTQIVSGSCDKSVRVWNASTGHEINVLQYHTYLVNSVAFSPDGRHIVSGSNDGSVCLWDASTGHQINALYGHRGGVTSVAFSPDGKHIVSASGDKLLQLWSTAAAIIQPQYIQEQAPHSAKEKTQMVFTGWLLSPDRQNYLMFVPRDAFLFDSSNVLTIPRSASSFVDFSNAVVGPQWSECYKPQV